MSEPENGMSFQQRLFLTVFLCLGIWMVFDLLNPPPPPSELEGDTDGVVAATDGDTGEIAPDTGGEQAQPEAGPEAGPDPAPQAAPTSDVERTELRIANEWVALDVVNEDAGSIQKTELLSSQFTDAEQTGLDFLHLGETLSSLGVGFDADHTEFSWSKGERWEVTDKSASSVTMRRASPDVEVTQRLELRDGYEAHYEVSVRNLSSRELGHQLTVRNALGGQSEEETSRYNIHRALCKTGDDLEEYELDDLEEGSERVSGGVRWTALTSQYFGLILVPMEGAESCRVDSDQSSGALTNVAVMPAARVRPGETTTYGFAMYLGAKHQDQLQNFSLVAGAELEESIDWGWFGALSRVLGGLLFDLLQWIHGLVGIWGVSIIILTAMIKVVTLPLTLKQYSSMKRMREIQPQIEEVKKKYGDDRTKQSQEMQALFQRTGVNPLAGCLPMLVQMPIWFALYSMLSAVVELYHETFLWLPDLTKPDPYYGLPLGMGVLMFIQTRIQPTAADNQQAKMMQWMMPGIFTVMMLFLPSGLGVYIFANIVLSLIQTFIQLRPGKKADTAAAK